MAFLDNAGLERLWGKITAKFTTLVGDTPVSTQITDAIENMEYKGAYYVKGTQTATTNAFTGVLNEVSALYSGLTINYWLPYSGTSTAATLNLTLKDGSTTGAIPVYYGSTGRFTTHVSANNVIPMVYQTVTISGTSYTGWWVKKVSDSDTTDRIRYSNTRVIAGTNGIYGYSLIALDNSNKWQGFVKSYSTGTTKTINTEAKFKLPINILYYHAGNNATNGNAVNNTYALYLTYPSLDLRYSCNYTTTFTTNTPVYLEGTIDSSGYFSVTSTCITQTLTSGKYYIFLGTSGNSTAYQLHLHTGHPVYYYDGTNLVDYTKKLYGNALSVSGKTVTLKNGLGESLSSITTQDTTYSAATTSAAGLMSKEDKTKLDGIATGANKTTVDSALSATSTNPVQNKVVNTAISNLNDLVGGESVASQIENAMGAITADSIGAMSIELLWENTVTNNQLAVMNAGNISVDWRPYQSILIEYAVVNTTANRLCSSIITCDPTSIIEACYMNFASGETDIIANRPLVLDDGFIRVTDCKLCSKGTLKTDTSTTNKYCIPRYIYGIKG